MLSYTCNIIEEHNLVKNSKKIVKFITILENYKRADFIWKDYNLKEIDTKKNLGRKKILRFFLIRLIFKVEKSQKQIDYAERVKARNKMILAEQKRNDDNGSIRSQQSPPSKTQRVLFSRI